MAPNPDEIAEAARSRATTVLDVYLTAFTETQNLQTAFAAGIKGLAESYRDYADQVAERKKRGWQSLSNELIAVAARVAATAVEINAIEPPESLPWVEQTTTTTDDADQLMAYLRGDSDTLPVGGDTPATSPLNLEAKAMTDMTFPIADNPFVDASTSTRIKVDAPAEWVDEHRYTYDQLMQSPIPPADLNHWSWSQLTTLENCGLQYRAQRVEQLPQVPQWANVGGGALHAASEAFDRIMVDPTNPAGHQFRQASPELLKVTLTEHWNEAFAAEMVEVASLSGLAMGEDGTAWRASNSGKEGYTWWLHEGADMLIRYATGRIALERAAEEAQAGRRTILTGPDGKPMIEWESQFMVPGPLGSLPVKVVLDRVWLTSDGVALIVDLKSGARKADDGQHGLYAWALRSIGWTGPIRATTYDARKGIYSPEFDPIEAHPWEEWVYRIHAAETQRRAGIYSPRRSDFCGGCSVRYACPVGG